MIRTAIDNHQSDGASNNYSNVHKNYVNRENEIFLIAITTFAVSGTTFIACSSFEYYEGMIASAFISAIAFSILRGVNKNDSNRIKVLQQESIELMEKGNRVENKHKHFFNTKSIKKSNNTGNQAPPSSPILETDIYELD